MDRKAKRKERFNAVYQAMEPLRIAKKNTIRTLAGIGRKHKILKYLIFDFYFSKYFFRFRFFFRFVSIFFSDIF